MYTTDEPDLSVRQKAIIEFLTKNTDREIIKETIVKALEKVGSRKVILDEIKNLYDYQIVGVEEKNRQYHRVHLRTDSELISILKHVSELKTAFFNLVEEAKPLIDELSRQDLTEGIYAKHDVWSVSDKVFNDSLARVHAQVAIRDLFTHMLGIYMLHFLFEWPKKVTDLKTREKLFSIAFHNIKEIQIELLKLFPPPALGSPNMDRGETVEDFFILKRDKLYSTAINLEYVDLGEACEAVLDSLWKFSSPFVLDAMFHIHEWAEPRKNKFLKSNKKDIKKILKDWRIIVKQHVNSLPPEKKKWSKSITDKY